MLLGLFFTKNSSVTRFFFISCDVISFFDLNEIHPVLEKTSMCGEMNNPCIKSTHDQTTNKVRDHFLIVYLDEKLKVNPYYCMLVS